MAKKKKSDDAIESQDGLTLPSEEPSAGGRAKRAAAQKVKYQEDVDDFLDDGLAAVVPTKGSKGSKKSKQMEETDDSFDEDAGDEEGEEEEEENDVDENVALDEEDEEGEDEDDFDDEEGKGKKKTKKKPTNKGGAAKKGRSAPAKSMSRKSSKLMEDDKPAKGKKETKPKETKGKDTKSKGKKDGKGANKKELQFSGPPDEVILNYLKAQNRPFSVNDIFNNMHGEIGKTQVLKTLTSLVSQGDIVMKTYGKQSVYVIRQDNLEKPSQAELDRMDNQIDAIKAQLNAEKEACKVLSAQLQQTRQTPTTEGAKQTVKQLIDETGQLRHRLERIEADGARGNLLPEAEKTTLNKLYETSRQEWKKRRRMCVDILETIIDGLMSANSESASKSKLTASDYIEQIGIEMDEHVGLDIKVDPLAAV